MNGVRSKIHTSYVHQDHLIKQLKSIFPNVHTHVDAKKLSALKYPTTGSYVELDIWIPEYNIAFEFQDTYHYVTTWYTQSPLDSIRQNDNIKRHLTHINELALLTIPCWWDGALDSLKATIHFQRPDLFPSNKYPIPLNPPQRFFPVIGLPDVGELMIASFPADPSFINLIPSNSWWMGEKYDGVRFCWNPKKRQANSRNGKQIPLPQRLVRSLPAKFVDGEFWFGRGLFSLTHSLIQSTREVFWDLLRMLCFDVISQYLAFEVRFKQLLESFIAEHQVCIVVARSLCRDKKHLNFFCKEIIQYGGEGIILQKSGSLYDHGRTPSLIKLKTAFVDKEGLVVSVATDFVHLKNSNGQIFAVPSCDVHVANLQKGDIVTFSYEIHARRELPVNPTITRIRTDVSWEDVILSSASEEKFLNEHSAKDSQSQSTKTRSVPSHEIAWTNMESRRIFFENYASVHGFDYKNANSWYSQPMGRIMAYKDVKKVIHYHNKSIPSALFDLFPDIGFEKSKFKHWPWHYQVNRRRFFEKFAQREKFNPLIAGNWYSQPVDKILGIEGSDIVLSYHAGRVSQALIELFPNVPFDNTKLLVQVEWKIAANRRRVFEEYARAHSFDPLIPSLWYSASRKRIIAHTRLLVDSYYSGSVSKALLDLFPEIGLEQSKFWTSTWRVPARRRAFFEEFAKENAFDPLIAESWYTRSREEIMSKPGASKVIAYHKNSVSAAICDLFPEVSFDKTKFWLRRKIEKFV